MFIKEINNPDADKGWVNAEDRINLSWTRSNRTTANNIINIGFDMMQYSNRSKYCVRKYLSDDVLVFRLHNLETGEYERKILVDPKTHDVLNIRKQEAVFDAFFYMVCAKMGYYDLEKKWETLGRICKTKNNTVVLIKNLETQHVVFQIQNKYPNAKFGDEELTELFKFKSKMNSLRNLKQFSPKNFEELALIALKIIRKGRIRRSRKIETPNSKYL